MIRWIRKKILLNGPWAFDKHLLVTGDYVGHIQPSKVRLDHSSFWVQVFDLPLGMMGASTAEFIGNKLGTYEGYDSKGSKVSWGKFLRIRVNLKLNFPLKRVMKLFVEGAVCSVYFKYECLPTFCYFCGLISHADRDKFFCWFEFKTHYV
ncbi:hypothetical protein ACH5RR_025374 [Cinchona calisaya]|uniref:Zinc knuckle CX2CX4HX4C domain-containing protein n=1 Tax=Cinchona calisaya TaxID=153742 RepID=A0ABD2Z3H3_9GENT